MRGQPPAHCAKAPAHHEQGKLATFRDQTAGHWRKTPPGCGGRALAPPAGKIADVRIRRQLITCVRHRNRTSPNYDPRAACFAGSSASDALQTRSVEAIETSQARIIVGHVA